MTEPFNDLQPEFAECYEITPVKRLLPRLLLEDDKVTHEDPIILDNLKPLYKHSDSKEAVQDSASPLIQAPVLVREGIYKHLGEKDRLNLRLTCWKICNELDSITQYSVSFRKLIAAPEAAIPFLHIKYLKVDNQFDDVPWFGLDPSNADCGPATTSAFWSKFYSYGRQPTVSEAKLISISQYTLNKLAVVKSLKAATLCTEVFQRKIPFISWPNLTTLRLFFHVTRSIGMNELEMLSNFDVFCQQLFPSLTNLKICLRRSYLNPQSSFSIRALRFMAKHWRTLKDAEVELEAERCDMNPRQPFYTSEFSDEEMEWIRRLQLRSLKLDATEILCRKCSVWQEVIKQQRSLDSLMLSIYAAEGHPAFFYPLQRDPGSKTMGTVSLSFWGLHSHYPIDLRRLTNGLEQIYNMRLFRSPSTPLSQIARQGPEILNMKSLPSELVSITIKGFAVASVEVEILLLNAHSLRHLTLKNCSDGDAMGLRLYHLKLLQEHVTLTTASVDVVNPVHCPDLSYDFILQDLKRGRLEYKIIASKDGTHSLLLIDRARASEVSAEERSKLDEEILPGQEYPTGFIGRFDNWKNR